MEYQPLYSKKNVKAEELYKITNVYLTVTQDCNLACKYCFVHKKHKSIKFETAIAVIDYLSENASLYNVIPSINFFGGEPLLRWKDIIQPAIAYVRKKYRENYDLSLTTNGVLIDEEILSFMKANDVGLLFSMDGDKNSQDINRPFKDGGSSFELLKNKIPIILTYYPFVTFRATTNNDSVQDLVINHKFAVSSGFKSVFNAINVFSNWTLEQKQTLENQVKELGNYYYDLIKAGKDVVFSPLHSMFNKLKKIEETKRRNGFRDYANDMLAFGRCGLGADRTAGVDTEGNFYSCHEMVGNEELGEAFLIGNINKGIDNNKRLELAKSFDVKKVVSQAGINSCKKCKFYTICDGSCLVSNYILSGDIHVMPSILCLYNKLLINTAEAIKLKAIESLENTNFIQNGII